MRTRPGIVLPVLIVMVLLTSSMWSTPKDGDEKIIFIGTLNFDCWADTVRGEKVADDGYLPRRILWGQGNKLDMSCDGKTPLHKRVKQTKFVYNGWKITGASVAFQSINGDSLTDIILHIKAVIPGEETTTLHSIALFGQHSINAVPVIHLGEIRKFQAEPFFAMQLGRGAELTKEGKRDLSGTTSYILERIDINLDRRDSVPPPPTTPLAGVNQHEAVVRVYPNPTGNTLSIEAMELAAGTYTLQVIAVNGDVVSHEEVVVGSGEGLKKILDLARFATGYYVVRIENATHVIGTYPIIITR